MTMNPTELKGALEAIIYAADEPATLDQIAKAIGEEKAAISAALEEMIAGFATEDRGIEIRAVAGGYKFYTKPQHHEAVRRFIKSLRPPLRLTMPALETLAVIAYRGPVTGPEIQEIRGVNVSGVVKTLLEKRLIATAGRKAVMGRPIMYRTSKEFLMRFGLSDLEELPSLKEFEQLARAALGSDEGIAPIEPEQLEVEVLSSEQDLATESAEATETSSQSEISDVNQPPAVAEAPDSIATSESTEHSATEQTNAVSDAPESMETIVEHKTDEVDAVSETVQQPHQETPEAATADAEHSEEAKAESAS
ncbi:MAG TPA: SMC-Scp complex subunit ScpB [Candidatus Saccharimonadales bacterium]|jgi:segregation and condensation protein B|nr:SMC-Scp complex subunit ScpB [Candidatus Saccharimonadales bacterium]